MERVSNPIIREGRRFHEKYMELHRLKEQYKNCKLRYLEAQKSLNKELSKPKTSMEAQVKGWAKVDELRREYTNISSHLLRFATQLEQEHHQALLEHVSDSLNDGWYNVLWMTETYVCRRELLFCIIMERFLLLWMR